MVDIEALPGVFEMVAGPMRDREKVVNFWALKRRLGIEMCSGLDDLVRL